jgi:hypothetical protein
MVFEIRGPKVLVRPRTTSSMATGGPPLGPTSISAFGVVSPISGSRARLPHSTRRRINPLIFVRVEAGGRPQVVPPGGGTMHGLSGGGAVHGACEAADLDCGRRLGWAQEHPAHGALHRAGAGSVQGFLAMMMRLEKLLSTYRPWRVLGQSANASSGSGRRGFWQEVSMTSRPRRTKSFMFSARVIRSPHQRGRAASANIRSANTHSPS